MTKVIQKHSFGGIQKNMKSTKNGKENKVKDLVGFSGQVYTKSPKTTSENGVSLAELLMSEEGLQAISALVNFWRIPFPEVEWVGGEDDNKYEWKVLKK